MKRDLLDDMVEILANPASLPAEKLTLLAMAAGNTQPASAPKARKRGRRRPKAVDAYRDNTAYYDYS